LCGIYLGEIKYIHPPVTLNCLCSPGRSSDFRIILLTAPSRMLKSSDIFAAFVPDYSGGPVLDFHEIPYL
jgi:hypothetical protein